MDHLLVVASPQGVPEGMLQSLRLAGWRLTVTADLTTAKQLLQRGEIAALLMDLRVDHDPERLTILRCVQQTCPKTMVIMLCSAEKAVDTPGSTKPIQASDAGKASSPPQMEASLDFYHLSPAQKRIAELVTQAYPNREIASKLKIKEQTVRNELSRIFRKMGVWNRVELTLLLRNEARKTGGQKVGK
jgi:DNA-binding NarL/FixJ family response regulator